MSWEGHQKIPSRRFPTPIASLYELTLSHLPSVT